MLKQILLLIALNYYFSTTAQVFWQEDFANGIPPSWSNEDQSPIGLIWTYCADTLLYGNEQFDNGNNPTCPYNFNDPLNSFQVKFKSETPDNGFGTCVTNPFLSMLYTTAFDSRLTTSAIDCKNKEEVYLTFNAHLGVYEQDASTNAEVNISIDGENWASYYPFPNLQASDNESDPGNLRWSRNPEKVILDISNIAANESTVFIQWRWVGNAEYHWSIDDIKLTSEDPSPAFDITLAPNTKYHAIMTNFQTPVSQMEPSFFLTDIANNGREAVNNVSVIAQVTDELETLVLYEESINIPNLSPNAIMEDILFPPYLHTAGIGNFKIIYSIDIEEEDLVPENNLYRYPFEVSENLYAKNLVTDNTVVLYPTDIDIDGNIIPNWSAANYYYVPHGNGYFLDEVIFEIPNRLENSSMGDVYIINDPDLEVSINFYRWDNLNEDNEASFSEYRLLGTNTFTVTGGDGNKPKIIKLDNVDGDGNIPLEDNKSYFLALEYSTVSSNKLFAVKASLGLNYDPMIQATNLNNAPRFAAMSRVGNVSEYNTFAFGGNVIPHIGFTITADAVSTSKILTEKALSIFPNPIQDKATVQFDFKVSEDADLSILTSNGQAVNKYLLHAGQKTIDINCAELANGTYILSLESKTVSAYKKLVVIH